MTLLAVGLGGLAPASSVRGADQQKIEPDIVVPYVPTHEKVVEAMLRLAAVTEGETVYDLGCGDGRIVITAVKDFKAKKGPGIDFNPERLKDCGGAGESRKAHRGASQAAGLQAGLQKGLKPGARIASHDFHMGKNWKAERIEKLEADRAHTIYLWTITGEQ